MAMVGSTVAFGAVFGAVWAVVGYAATRGRRDFSSITQVVATRYEVLVEHKVAARARSCSQAARRAAESPTVAGVAGQSAAVSAGTARRAGWQTVPAGGSVPSTR